ncbi:MAG: DUF6786 family protein [Petrimonas sp.]|jgi:hypothetical protein
MRIEDFLSEFDKAKKRVHVVGTAEASVIIALDMEGRIFTVLNGEVINRINTDAIKGQSTRNNYLNPGGDALWPAPEGTTLGYQYSTGSWRVSPAISAARYVVTGSTDKSVVIEAEIDLVNNQGLGFPTIFKRNVYIQLGHDVISVSVTESITYIGDRVINSSECSLAPWSLCQLNCGPGCNVVFPCMDKSHVWGLYENEVGSELTWDNNQCKVLTEGANRFQVGISEKVPYIEFFDPVNGLRVKRESSGVSPRESYIDIRDVQPTIVPDSRGVRYSVYNDSNRFMEIEAVGGCPGTIQKGTEMNVTIITTFARLKS